MVCRAGTPPVSSPSEITPRKALDDGEAYYANREVKLVERAAALAAAENFEEGVSAIEAEAAVLRSERECLEERLPDLHQEVTCWPGLPRVAKVTLRIGLASFSIGAALRAISESSHGTQALHVTPSCM